MKVPHRELEELRSDLAAWVARKRNPGGFPRIGYDHAVRLSIYRYHKTVDPDDAKKYLIKTLDGNGLTNAGKREFAQLHLMEYLAWVESSSPIVLERKARIALDFGDGAMVCGEIGRIDLDEKTGNYRGILLVDAAPLGWADQLRFPIIQQAIANRLQRDAECVVVGVQELSGGACETMLYDSDAIEEAVDEARTLIQQAATALSSKA